MTDEQNIAPDPSRTEPATTPPASTEPALRDTEEAGAGEVAGYPAGEAGRVAEYPSGSAEPAEGGQGGSTQKPLDTSPPPPTASFNSEAGWSGGGPDPTGHPAPGQRTEQPQAARTEADSVHTMRGMQIGAPVLDAEGRPLVGTGMFGGGNIVAEHLPPPPPQSPADMQRQWTWHAMQSPHFSLLGALAGRPVSDWGLIGKGATVRGLFLGINVDTLEKELFHDGHVIERDGVWANVRQFPEDVVAGDALQRIAASRR